ncbi:endochitinase-like [Corylus avellana]|uniref:endochitinase-like n=1 Tax=Corylus avellana TaxID=13451 RepID=UPI00286D1A28|nr:endochitinase-like [Corylus avellana]
MVDARGEIAILDVTPSICKTKMGLREYIGGVPANPLSDAKVTSDLTGGALCPNGLCCIEYGWCGTTIAYCGTGCQSQCAATPPPPSPNPTPSPPPPQPNPVPTPVDGIASIISASLFDEFLKYRNDPQCRSNGFYTYNAFIAAADSFAGFGTTGDVDTRKREIAAFLGQTSHETTGGWADAPDGPYAWGYCFVEEINQGDYCTPSNEWPCAPGKQYFGRGPIQLTHNYNYGQAGQALGLDLLNNPDLVAQDATISFKTAIWFWMTPQGNKPSSHDVIIGKWTPTAADTAAGRAPGYGVITNIINGGLECVRGPDSRVENRIGFYKRYCDAFGVSYGDNLDCNNQRPFA